MKNIADASIDGRKKVLVAPLDWGLGHTTRCVPIIRSLLQRGHQVFIAGNEPQKKLLQAEFPFLAYLPLRGYEIKYGVSAVQTIGLLLRQIPQIRAAIRHEHLWLQRAMTQYGFDTVISDNRYGLYHPQAQGIIITHQLRIQAPLAQGLIQRVHYRLLRRFDGCWVPDVPHPPGLAGALAHPRRMPPVPVRYLGPLSRFANEKKQDTGSGLLLLLSGPEPQRSIFEQLLLRQVAHQQMPIVLVRGLPGGGEALQVPAHVRVYNHLPAAKLEAEIKNAAYVIGRSGYSTVMDLAAVGKKSILVPTPGQTEQAYLARHLQQQGFALSVTQNDFDLQKALEKAAQFAYSFPASSPLLLQEALDAWEESPAR